MLGEGTYGQVYKAYDRNKQINFALKKAVENEDEGDLHEVSFEKEINILLILNRFNFKGRLVILIGRILKALHIYPQLQGVRIRNLGK